MPLPRYRHGDQMRAMANKGKIHANQVICQEVGLWMDIACLEFTVGHLSLGFDGMAGLGDSKLVGIKNA